MSTHCMSVPQPLSATGTAGQQGRLASHKGRTALTLVLVALVIDMRPFSVEVPHGALNPGELVHTAL